MISNEFLYSTTTSSSLFLMSLQGSQIPTPTFDYVKKKAYKDYNIPSMCITKDNLLKTKIARLVRCATQCTPMKNGTICYFV
jgi:hypothetical protein